MTKTCPFCSSNNKPSQMIRMEGLPPYLDIVQIAKEHPMPLLRSFVENKAKEIKRAIEAHTYYYKCPRCGFIALFEK